MALVGHISGSNQSSSVIGVSGSVIVANRPSSLFPSLPGADVSFFVSGSRGGKNGSEKTVSVFGGDAVVSGSLTIGTGSVTITSNDVQFGTSARIELNGSNLKFYDANNPSGYSLTTLATSSPAGNDTYVQFNDGGSFGAQSSFTFDKSNSRLSVTHINAATALTASQVVPASGVGGIVTVQGDVKLSGNDIIASDDSYSIQLQGSSDVKVGGDLTVGGNDIKAGDGAIALTLSSTTGDVAVAGDLTVTGNDIKSSTGATAITLAGASVIIPGDLTVNGAMVTANTTNLEIKDSVIGLGFASGSVAQTVGDRGWIGGLAGVNNVMNKWDNTNSEFAFARTTSSATGSFAIASYSNLHANNIQGNIVSASLGFSGSLTKLIDGTSAFIASTGISITSASNGAVTIATSGASTVAGSDTQVQFNDGGVFGASSTFTFAKSSGAGGLGRLTVNEGSITVVTSSNIKAGASTVTLFNDTATTISMGGVATSTAIGATAAGTVTAVSIGGATNSGPGGNSTLNVSTGSFGRVLASSTSTFTGAATFNGGLTTTTLAASGAASLLSTLSVTGNITGQGTSNQLNALAVTGSAGLAVSSGATVGTTLSVTGNITGQGTSNQLNALAVTGSAGLSVTSGATIGTTLSVTGNITGQGTSNQLNALSVTGSLGLSVTSGATVGGATLLNGNVTLGDASADVIYFSGSVGTSILPQVDSTYSLGSATLRWQHMYTGDLHLKNERGDYTLIEEPDFLSIRFNKNGKRYKFLLEPVPELDEELGKFSNGPSPEAIAAAKSAKPKALKAARAKKK